MGARLPADEMKAAKRKRQDASPPPLELVMSFLKDTRGALTWSTAAMAKELGIGTA